MLSLFVFRRTDKISVTTVIYLPMELVCGRHVINQEINLPIEIVSNTCSVVILPSDFVFGIVVVVVFPSDIDSGTDVVVVFPSDVISGTGVVAVVPMDVVSGPVVVGVVPSDVVSGASPLAVVILWVLLLVYISAVVVTSSLDTNSEFQMSNSYGSQHCGSISFPSIYLK